MTGQFKTEQILRAGRKRMANRIAELDKELAEARAGREHVIRQAADLADRAEKAEAQRDKLLAHVRKELARERSKFPNYPSILQAEYLEGFIKRCGGE